METPKYGLIWEEITQNQSESLYRAKVPGGWLIKEVCESYHYSTRTHSESWQEGFTTTICFLPDPKWEWLSTEYTALPQNMIDDLKSQANKG